jgi:hypothetical protein
VGAGQQRLEPGRVPHHAAPAPQAGGGPPDPRFLLTVYGTGYRLALAPPPPTRGAPPYGLIGRQAELALLQERLAEPVVVTLKGPPGRMGVTPEVFLSSKGEPLSARAYAEHVLTVLTDPGFEAVTAVGIRSETGPRSVDAS